MHTFSYTPDPQNSYDHTSVTVSTNTPSLEEVLQAFEQYLRATGFHFVGVVDIVNDEPSTPTDNP